MDGFERRKEKKRESIVNAALELFGLYGFKKVSINDIAQKANVSPVTIYNHFGSKDGLVQKTITGQFNIMMEKYREIIHGEGTFAEKLENIVFDKIGVASKYSGELAQAVYKGDGEYQQLINEMLMEDTAKITLELFDYGRQEGYVSANVSDDTVLIYLEILRRGIEHSTRLYTVGDAYPKIAEELNQLILYGLIDTGDRKEFIKK